MGHGYRPIVFKIEVLPPNRKATRLRNKNLLKYIATREGVDLTRVNSFEDAMNENLDLNMDGEEKAFQAASDEGYLKYMAHRPRSHGLFGNIDTENFAEVSKKLNAVSNEKKAVYRCTISLSETDGKALGYNTSAKWQLYLQSIMPDIATAINVSPTNMTWVAAFHAEETHPHVHIMMWDNKDKVQNPFVNKKQRTACWEICQNAMFTDENEKLIKDITKAERDQYYEKQNASRKEITEFFKDIFKDCKDVPGAITETMPGRLSAVEHRQLNSLYKSILETLPSGGSMKYTFMPPECKAYIDQVTEVFLKRPEIKREYDQYRKATEDIHKSLGKTKWEIEQAVNRQLFAKKDGLYTRIGNTVLKGVYGIKDVILNPLDEMSQQEQKEFAESMLSSRIEPDRNIEGDGDIDENEDKGISEYDRVDIEGEENSAEDSQKKYMIAFPELYEFANEKSEKYNPVEAEKIILELMEKDTEDLSLHYLLGKLYAKSDSILFNQKEAVVHLEKALNGGINLFDIHTSLGSIYSNKDFVKFDIRKAEEHYLAAIDINPKKSNFVKLRLSRLYVDKESELFDYEKALNILSDATNNAGSVSLQKGNIYKAMGREEEALKYYEDSTVKKFKNYNGEYQLGKMFLNPNKEYFDMEQGMEHLHIAAEEIPRAGFILGKCYREDRDYERAEECWNRALEQLFEKEKKPFFSLSNIEKELKSTIYLNLAEVYADENGSRYNKEEAEKCFRNSLETLENIKEDYSGRIALQKSMIFSNENSSLYDMDKTVEYMRLSADAGNTIAQYRLGKILVDKESTYFDKEEGLKLLHSAADKNFTPAILKLGFIFSSKKEQEYNPEKAMEYLKKALKNGYVDDKGIAALYMGMICTDENYLKNDMEKAVQYFIKSANCENSAAMVKLGFVLSKRELSLYNPTKAMEYLQRAAASGYVDDKGIVSLRMGILYADENCFDFNMKEALNCFMESANCGNTSAMVKLAKCYRYGIGVEKDKKIADYWLNEAIERGDEYAKNYTEKIEEAQIKAYSYALLRQIFLSMQQTRAKKGFQLQDIDFKTRSKQVQKEEHLHQK